MSASIWNPSNLLAAFSSSLVNFLQSGTFAVLRTVENKLRDAHVSSTDFNAETVTQNIDAAVAASSGRVIVIPRSVGAGEPTAFPLTNIFVDLREAPVLAGRKIVPNGSDANGRNLLNLIDDQIDPPLSHAALLAGHRPTGTLPNNRNGEGAQVYATAIGAINNNPLNYILSGIELGATIASNGGKIPYVWGAHSYANIAAGKTTNAGELVSHKIIGAAHAGAGTVDSMFSLDVEDTVGSATAKACARFQGNLIFKGDFNLTRGAASGSTLFSGNAAQFYYLDIGRSSSDLRLGVAGAVNDFVAGTASGDAVIGANTLTKKLMLLANGDCYAKLASTGLSSIAKIYPPQDTAAFQTSCGLYAGVGAPNNANGANGDIYFRSDGGAGTTIYQRRGGVWVGIV